MMFNQLVRKRGSILAGLALFVLVCCVVFGAMDMWPGASVTSTLLAIVAPGPVIRRPRVAGGPVTNRVEKIGSISMSAVNTEFTLLTNGGLLPSDRFIAGLILTWRGRTTNPASGNPTGTKADAPWSILNSIVVEGYHRPRGTQEQFMNIRGSEVRELNRLYTALEPPTTPASLSVAASATNDIEFTVYLPFTPMGLPIQQKIGWLLDAPNYDRLQFRMSMGDSFSIFTGHSGTVSFSAFGSATGSPSLEVSGVFAQAGLSRFRGFIPGRVWRYWKEVTGSNMTTTATGVRLVEVPRGFKIRSIMLKTGVKATDGGAGNNVYTTLSDSILTNLTLYRGINKINRSYWRNSTLQFFNGLSTGVRPSAGYQNIDYLSNGWDGELLDTAGLVAGPTGDVDVFLSGDVTGASNQAMLALFEEWRQWPAQLR